MQIMKINVNNPFRIHGVVSGHYFTNRADEVDLMVKALTDPGSKLLVYGPRRMGKTSAVLEAISHVNKAGGIAFLADLSTSSTAIDMGNRILAAATKVLGRKWKTFVTDLVSKLNVSVNLNHDPATGIILPSVDFSLRQGKIDNQRKTLVRLLDAINQLAKDRKSTIGIALDEFQEIHKFGGRSAEWDLRSTIQHHDNIGYILSGSREHIIQRMMESKGAFYKLVDKMQFTPIDPDYLAKWINERLASAGLKSAAFGESIVRMAGPRTRDIVQLARKCFDLMRSRAKPNRKDVELAFEEIVDEDYDLLQSQWDTLTAHRQNVLRAISAGQKGLTTQETLSKFSLGSSGTVTNTVNALVKEGILIRDELYKRKRVASATGYDFDSPFFKAWVIRYTLSDIGLPGVSP